MSFSTPTQTATINGFGAAVATTLTATAAGSLIVVGITSQLATGTSGSVTDNIGNTYSLAISGTGASQRHEEIWYCLSAAAGVTTVTVNNSTSVNVAGYAQEWAGGSPSLRAASGLSNSSSASPPAATVTPAVGDLVFGVMGYQAAVASTRQETAADGTYTALTGIQRGTTVMVAGAWKIATATTATGPSWTMSPAVSTGEATAAFAPAIAGAGSVTAVPATATASAPAPAELTTVTVSGGGAASASLSAPSPIVSGTVPVSGSVTAVAATATGLAPAPFVSSGAIQVGSVVAVPSVVAFRAIGPAVTAASVTVAGGFAYYYMPPMWNNIQQMEGSLRYKIPTSTTTFRKGGVWYNVQSPGMGVVDGADFVFNTPQYIPSAIAAELLSFGVGTLNSIPLPDITLTFNPDGTVTMAGVTDNGDGTFTFSGVVLRDNGNGTMTLAA